MMTIKQLVDHSREYHGTFKPERKTCSLYYYESPEGLYMCAIGCNLQNPKELQKVLAGWGEYNIGHVARYRQREFKEMKYLGDPVLKSLLNERLSPLAAKLQVIHDDARTVGAYLEKLDEWEASGFDLNFETGKLMG
jgi:hypothetical protein